MEQHWSLSVRVLFLGGGARESCVIAQKGAHRAPVTPMHFATLAPNIDIVLGFANYAHSLVAGSRGCTMCDSQTSLTSPLNVLFACVNCAMGRISHNCT